MHVLKLVLSTNYLHSMIVIFTKSSHKIHY